MKAVIAKLCALLFMASGIYLLLPAGPLWYLWYGQKPGTHNEADKLTIVAVSILLLGLSILFVIVMASLFRQWITKGPEEETAPVEESN